MQLLLALAWQQDEMNGNAINTLHLYNKRIVIKHVTPNSHKKKKNKEFCKFREANTFQKDNSFKRNHAKTHGCS